MPNTPTKLRKQLLIEVCLGLLMLICAHSRKVILLIYIRGSSHSRHQGPSSQQRWLERAHASCPNGEVALTLDNTAMLLPSSDNFATCAGLVTIQELASRWHYQRKDAQGRACWHRRRKASGCREVCQVEAGLEHACQPDGKGQLLSCKGSEQE